MADKTPYNDQIGADRQITAEEGIVTAIEDKFLNGETDLATGGTYLNDEQYADLGRDILYIVLKEFRPDLFFTEE